ncbi:unnamed protein product [Haemonchus placei]|uniref:Reverse transcriptase domain-containing protein n=1 Tax=Haemonchus placei TaxID=6290 RepID=A0A0N4WQS7_HAEPC|nr:unnamed protein product [Haemonchus placei]
MTTFNLKSGYHHVRILEGHMRYFLPFGLSSAPYIFTKLYCFIKVWRTQGRGVAIYIDDGIIFERSVEACSETVYIIRANLSRAGWFFAQEKCKWSPSQTCQWLGLDVNLSSMIISVSTERLSKAMQIPKEFTKTAGPHYMTDCVGVE